MICLPIYLHYFKCIAYGYDRAYVLVMEVFHLYIHVYLIYFTQAPVHEVEHSATRVSMNFQ